MNYDDYIAITDENMKTSAKNLGALTTVGFSTEQ